MTQTEIFLKEMEAESNTTRKMLSIIPDDKYQWKPHEKSMTIEQLSTHIAELPTWVPMVLNTTELDFATAPYEPKKIGSTAALMELFEKSLAEGKAGLEATKEDQLAGMWTLRTGAGGTIRAIWCGGTRGGCCTSSGGGKRSSAGRARTSAPPRSRPCWGRIR